MTAEKETASFVNSCLSAQTWSIFAYISQPSVNVNPCLFDERGVKYPKGKSRKNIYNSTTGFPPNWTNTGLWTRVYSLHRSIHCVAYLCVWKICPRRSPSWQVVGKCRESSSYQESHGTNCTPQKWWLGDYFPLGHWGRPNFRCYVVSFRNVCKMIWLSGSMIGSREKYTSYIYQHNKRHTQLIIHSMQVHPSKKKQPFGTKLETILLLKWICNTQILGKNQIRSPDIDFCRVWLCKVNRW